MKRGLLFIAFYSFILTFGMVNVEAESLSDGVYTIESALGFDKVISVEDSLNIKLSKNNNSNAQKWKIKNLNGGYYTISSLSNEKKFIKADESNVYLEEKQLDDYK